MEMFNYTSFPHFREDRAITKDSDYSQKPDKQAKVRNLEKQIDPVRCLLSNGVDQMVYKLYGLTEEEIKIVEDTSRQ